MLKVTNKKIALPTASIYEMVEGMPIFYRSHSESTPNNQPQNDIMGSSVLQSILIELIKDHLKQQLPSSYLILGNEIGLQINKNSWRAADIAVFDKQALLQQGLNNKYASIPPKYIIEVDTKIAANAPQDVESYLQKKTKQLLNFGVQQIIWVFTNSASVMIADKTNAWKTINWTDTIKLEENCTLNIQQLLDLFND